MKHKDDRNEAQRYNDLVKPGCGIDGSKGENFTKNRQDPWSPPKMGGEDIAARGNGRYTNNNPGLRNTPPGSGTGATHDILDNVERNSTPGSGAIRYGVD